MADAGVTGVVAKLGELAKAEATALLRVDAEIRSLRRKLAYLQALVRGADRQRRGRASELLLLWLSETREVAFEVEDAVDEFHLRVEAFHLRANWRRGWWHRAANLVQGLVTQVPGSASSVYVREPHPRIGIGFQRACVSAEREFLFRIGLQLVSEPCALQSRGDVSITFSFTFPA